MKLTLPLVALGLDLVPLLLILLLSLGLNLTSFALLLIILPPIAGLVLGVEAFRQSKAHAERAAKIISIIAVAIPLAMVAYVVIIFLGVVTGVVPLM